MNGTPDNEQTPDSAPPDPMASEVRRRAERRAQWLREGEPSVMRFLGQIGALGWIVIAPTLVGLFLGRWLDAKFSSGIFWSAPLLMLGVAVGCWTAWRWINKQ